MMIYQNSIWWSKRDGNEPFWNKKNLEENNKTFDDDIDFFKIIL